MAGRPHWAPLGPLPTTAILHITFQMESGAYDSSDDVLSGGLTQNANSNGQHGGGPQGGNGGGRERTASWVGDVAQAAAQRFSGDGGVDRRRSRNL